MIYVCPGYLCTWICLYLLHHKCKIERRHSQCIAPDETHFESVLESIYLTISLTMYFGCSKEPYFQDGAFYTNTICFDNKNETIHFQKYSLIWSNAINMKYNTNK